MCVTYKCVLCLNRSGKRDHFEQMTCIKYPQVEKAGQSWQCGAGGNGNPFFLCQLFANKVVPRAACEQSFRNDWRPGKQFLKISKWLFSQLPFWDILPGPKRFQTFHSQALAPPKQAQTLDRTLQQLLCQPGIEREAVKVHDSWKLRQLDADTITFDWWDALHAFIVIVSDIYYPLHFHPKSNQ